MLPYSIRFFMFGAIFWASSHRSFIRAYGPHKLTAEQRVFSYLFDSGETAFIKDVRPILDHEDSVKVRLGICLMAIDNIIEKEQTLISTGCVKMKWRNELMHWDPEEFDNLTWVIIPSSEIWIPDLALVNSPEPFRITRQAGNLELSYTGEVGYYPSGLFTTRCSISLTYYPYDTQLCELKFESWAYPVQKLELVPWSPSAIDLKDFVENHQWRLDGYGVQLKTTLYDGLNFSSICFYISFSRRSLYDVLFAIYPCMLMAALQLCSHTLPVQLESRMGLLTSLFIASSVIQSSVGASMPKSSDSISVFQIYLVVFSGALLCSIVETAVCLHMHHQTPHNKPPCVSNLLVSIFINFGKKTTNAPKEKGKPAKRKSPRQPRRHHQSEEGPRQPERVYNFSILGAAYDHINHQERPLRTLSPQRKQNVSSGDTYEWAGARLPGLYYRPGIDSEMYRQTRHNHHHELNIDQMDQETWLLSQSAPQSARSSKRENAATSMLPEREPEEPVVRNYRDDWINYAADVDKAFFYLLAVFLNVVAPAVLFLVLPFFVQPDPIHDNVPVKLIPIAQNGA